MKVSVLMTTYNHERFIEQALEGALMQKVDFDYEVVIGEDGSTDGTRQIVIDYQKRYPERIRLLLRGKNRGDIGKYNFADALNQCRGEYISLLDGDDYWTSPHKLQKQVDFLDGHPECAICFHGVKELYEDRSRKPLIFLPPGKREIYGLEDLLERNLIHSVSATFRRGLFGELPDWFYLTPLGDWPLHILNAQHGKIGYINEVMGVYRIRKDGVWSSQGRIYKLREEIKACKFINAHFNFRYHKLLRSKMSQRFFWIAEEYKQNGNYVHALRNLFDSVMILPHYRAISSLCFFSKIIELFFPKTRKILEDLLKRYLKY